MKFFIDTEFKEKPNTIDLISIGIVCENGNEYYALNKDFNLSVVWKDEWLRENVLLPIYTEHVSGDMRNSFSFSISSMKWILKSFGKSKPEIASEIKAFVYRENHNIHPDKVSNFEDIIKIHPIEFYGYFADYDWVVFCWIFGKMIDLPKGFPKYCRDLKQIMDEMGLDRAWKYQNCPDPKGIHNALIDARWNLELFSKICLEKQKPGR